MHDFSVNRLTVFKCVCRDGMLYLMPLQNTLATASAAAPVNVLTADRTSFCSCESSWRSFNCYQRQNKQTKNWATCRGNKAPAKAAWHSRSTWTKMISCLVDVYVMKHASLGDQWFSNRRINLRKVILRASFHLSWSLARLSHIQRLSEEMQ